MAQLVTFSLGFELVGAKLQGGREFRSGKLNLSFPVST